MAKPFDPILLDPSRYPFHVDVGTRFADMDINGHINNVAMAAAFEDARTRFDFAHCQDASRQQVMIVATYIDYLAQAHYPHVISYAVGVASIGRSTWVMSQLATQNGVARALCRATMVNTDGAKALALSDRFRQTLSMVRMPISEQLNAQ